MLFFLDIDECTTIADVCDSNAECTNDPPGSYTCNCKRGYTDVSEDGDGTSCERMYIFKCLRMSKHSLLFTLYPNSCTHNMNYV